MSRRLIRQLVVAWVGLALISWIFPLVAGVVDFSIVPSWMGLLDVAFAAAYAGLGLFLLIRAGTNIAQPAIVDSYRIVQIGAFGIIILLVAFFLGATPRWEVLLIGLGWRAWLAITVLPGVLSLWRADAG